MKRTRGQVNARGEAWQLLLNRVLRSISSRPAAWLLGLWLAGWALFGWQAIYPASWEAILAAIDKALAIGQVGPAGQENQGASAWLGGVGILGSWGLAALYVSTVVLGFYVSYALWVWRRYTCDWIWQGRAERLKGGQVLEVLIPPGSKADARASADMLGQLWKALSSLSRSGSTMRRGVAGRVAAERCALSLEMWSTAHTDGKVGFYIWCPCPGEYNRLVEEVRHLVLVHHPRCRVRWVDDPFEQSLLQIRRTRPNVANVAPEEPDFVPLSGETEPSPTLRVPARARAAGKGAGTALAIVWYDLALIADSRYPIGSGASDERLTSGTSAGAAGAGNRISLGSSRPGSPGAGSDPLAAVIDLLGSARTSIASGQNGLDDSLGGLDGSGGADSAGLIGVQVVAAAMPQVAGQTQQAVSQELARLRDLEAQFGKKALGPQHEARILALEEKADRQGFDTLIRLVVAVPVAMALGTGTSVQDSVRTAEAQLDSLLRAYARYDRLIVGVRQGFRVARKSRVLLVGPVEPSKSSALGKSGASAPTTPTTPTAPTPDGPSNRVQARTWMRPAAPVLGRWPREGVCLPRMLPFMKIDRPCVLNSAELSAVYHFPHQGLDDLSALRWDTYRQIPPPASARVAAQQEARGLRVTLGVADEDLPPPGQPPMGTSTPGHTPGNSPGQATSQTSHTTVLPPGTRGVGTTPQDLRRGSYVFGPMGSGKSVFLYNIIVQYMASGRGVGLIDGKGDSYDEVLQLVPPHLEGEVLTFDPENRPRGRNGAGGAGGAGGSAGRSIGINPLDGKVVAQLGAEKVESLTMGLMKKMMGANWEQSVLMQRFLRDGLLAVLDVEPTPTMLNLWRWLKDDGKGGNEYREARVGRIRNQLVRDFWQQQVPDMSSQQRSSMQNVLTRVDRYVKNDVRNVILHPHSTVNFLELLDRGTIFIARVSPRLGEDQSFLGALVLNGFLMGAFARQSIPQEQRRDYLLVVDEFQNFVDTARADVERMLSMARGYRLGLMLAHQFTEQLPKDVLSAILKNVQTWVLFGLQADDARLFASYMGLKAEDFQNLPPYHTYQRTIVGNTQTGVYSARPLPPPPLAANPGARSTYGAHGVGGQAGEQSHTQSSKEAQEQAWEALRGERGAYSQDGLLKLVRGPAAETDQSRRARMLKLAVELYGPAEEGDDVAVQALSLLGRVDLEAYRWVRQQVLDRKERERILAQPHLIPDKAKRIERLSALRWGTPCVEVEALIRAATRLGGARTAEMTEHDDDGDDMSPPDDNGPDDDYGSSPISPAPN